MKDKRAGSTRRIRLTLTLIAGGLGIFILISLIWDSPPAIEIGEEARPIGDDTIQERARDERSSEALATPFDEAAVLESGWVSEARGGWRRRAEVASTSSKYPLLRIEGDVVEGEEMERDSWRAVSVSVADHVLVGAADGVPVVEAAAALARRGFEIRNVQDGAFLLVAVPEPELVASQARTLAALAAAGDLVAFAEPDYLVWPSVSPDDPAFAEGRMWGLNNMGGGGDVDAPEAWDTRTSAAGVVIAITDSGMRLTHEDLAPALWTNGDEVAGDGIDNDANGVVDDIHGFDAIDNDGHPEDSDGHGTHVAGTAGARGNNGLGIPGVAWDVELMAVRFLGADGGTTSDAIRSLDYAREQGADIVNASWGGPDFSLGLSAAVERCRDAGIIIVAAAGNESADNDAVPSYPANFSHPNIVSVASSTRDDTLSAFSNYGRYRVDLAAPGGGIWSCYHRSDSDYSYLNGTSMAAPFVSGALALAKAELPGESAEQLIARLLSSVDRPAALAGKVLTGGRLNIASLLNASDPSLANDDFSGALAFDANYGFWSGSLTAATREADEDDFSIPDTGTHSLWFAWQAAHDGLVTVSARSGSGALRLVVFAGEARDGLAPVADGGTPSPQEEVYFEAEAGRAYRILLDSSGGAPFAELELVQPPANDNLADAIPLTGQRFTATGTNVGATREPFEATSPHAGVGVGQSVWWRWTAGADGAFAITTEGSAFDTVLAVYTGEAGLALQPVASSDDRGAFDWSSGVEFDAVAGTEYLIAVDSYRPEHRGGIVLNGFEAGALVVLKDLEPLRVRPGQPAAFEFVVSGDEGVSIDWFKDGIRLPFESGPTLEIERVSDADAGVYHALARRGAAEVHSSDAPLELIDSPPEIVWQSSNQAVAVGSDVTLKVVAFGSAPLSYQWYHDDVPLADEVGDTLMISSVSLADVGNYHVVVSNPFGATASPAIRLTAGHRPWGSWTWVRPQPFSSTIENLEFVNGEFVGLSPSTVSVSRDGTNWQHHRLIPGGEGIDIAYGNGVYVLANNSYQPAPILTSPDLREWTGVQLGGFTRLFQVEFANGVFVGRSSSTAYVSTDGAQWNEVAFAPAGDGAYDMAVGGGLFAMTTLEGRVFTSPDGANWTERPGAPIARGTLAFASGEWHFWGEAFGGEHWQTSDFVTWTGGEPGRCNRKNSGRQGWVEVIDGRFVCESSGNTEISIWDAGEWRRVSLGFEGSIKALADGGAAIIAVGRAGTFGHGTSLETLALEPYPGDVPNAIVVPLRDEFVLTNGKDALAFSTNGDVWQWENQRVISGQGFDPAGLSYAFGEYWAPPGGSGSFTSPARIYRGTSLGALPSEPVGDMLGILQSLRAGAGKLVGVVTNSTGRHIVLTGDGGETWTDTGALASHNDHQLHFLRDRFVLLSGREVFVSVDGLAWTSTDPADLQGPGNASDAVYLAACDAFGKICVLSTRGDLVTSGDGSSWDHRTIPGVVPLPPSSFRNLSAAGEENALVAVWGRGEILFTEDLATWIMEPAPSPQISQVVHERGTYVITGGSFTALCHGTVRSPAARVELSSDFDGLVATKSGLPMELDFRLVDPAGLFSHFNIYSDGELIVADSQTPSLDLSALRAGEQLIEIEAVSTDGRISRQRGSIELREPAFVRLTDNPPFVTAVAQVGGEAIVGDWHGRLWRERADGTWDVSGLPRTLPIEGVSEAGGAVYVTTHDDTYRSEDLINFERVAGAITGIVETPFGLAGGFGSGQDAFGATSPDGRVWEEQAWEWPMAFGGGLFLAVGGGFEQYYRSADGVSFRTLAEQPQRGVAVSFHDGRFLAGGLGVITSSADGDSWVTEHTFGLFQAFTSTLDTAYGFESGGGRLFATAATRFGNTPWLSFAYTGAGWEQIEEPLLLEGGVHFAEGAWWVANVFGLHRSEDGLHWELLIDGDAMGDDFREGSLAVSRGEVSIIARTGMIADIDVGLGALVPRGRVGEGRANFEMPGAATSGVGRFGDFAGGASGILLVWEDEVWLTDDFETYERVEPAGIVRPLAAAADTGYSLVDWLGRNFESIDGRVWVEGAPLALGSSNNPVDVLRAGDTTVVITNRVGVTNIFTKQGAGAWASMDVASTGIAPGARPETIRWLDGEFWLITNRRDLLRSPDGINWSIHAVDINWIPSAKLDDLYYGESYRGSSGEFATSSDLNSWTTATGPGGTFDDIVSIAAHGGRLFLSYASGSVFEKGGLGLWQRHELSSGPLSLSQTPGRLYAWSSASGPASVWGLCGDGDFFTGLSVHAGGEIVGAGDAVTFDLVRANRGEGVSPAASGVAVELVLSADRRLGGDDDIRLGELSVDLAELAPGTSETHTLSVILPDGVGVGDYRAFARASKPCPDGPGERQLVARTAAGAIVVPEWELALDVQGQGEVLSDKGRRRFAHKETVSLSARAGKGARFVGWAGDAFGGLEQITIIMDSDKSVQALFDAVAPLQVFVQGSGTVAGLPPGGGFDVGSAAVLTAIPAPGWEFVAWSGAAGGTDLETGVVMDAPKGVTAHFALSWESWLGLHFTPEELADSAISGSAANPDADPKTNWQEYLQGTDPRAADLVWKFVSNASNDMLSVVFTRLQAPAGGGALVPMASDDLTQWAGDGVEVRVLAVRDGVETVEARVSRAGRAMRYLSLVSDGLPQP